MQHVIDYTPYEGLEVTGWPVATVKGGRVAMRDGKVQAEPGTGQFLPRGPYAMIKPTRRPARRLRCVAIYIGLVRKISGRRQAPAGWRGNSSGSAHDASVVSWRSSSSARCASASPGSTAQLGDSYSQSCWKSSFAVWRASASNRPGQSSLPQLSGRFHRGAGSFPRPSLPPAPSRQAHGRVVRRAAGRSGEAGLRAECRQTLKCTGKFAHAVLTRGTGAWVSLHQNLLPTNDDRFVCLTTTTNDAT